MATVKLRMEMLTIKVNEKNPVSQMLLRRSPLIAEADNVETMKTVAIAFWKSPNSSASNVPKHMTELNHQYY